MKEKTKKINSNLTSHFSHHTSDHRGITLIALIITIIVMLILVAVTISVALNGGIISKAQEAKTKTEEAQIAERDLLTGRIKVGDTWYDSLDEYLKDNPSEDQSDGPSKWGQDDEGNITYDGEKSELKVGDYVDYGTYVKASSVGTNEIDGLYKDLKEYSGYTGSTYEKSYPITKEDLKWRVLDIKDGQIRLISDGPTSAKVYLRGYQGYNNAVYLIDKVCSTLYTTKKGTAQNLKIEDIEEKMNLDYWDYHNYINTKVETGKYGGTKEYSGNYSYYPAIFEKEKKQYIWKENKFVEGTELDLSEQTGPISQRSKMPANPTDDDKIKITLTYWIESMSESNWKNPTYQNIFIKDSSGSNYDTYWLSSRCVGAELTSASFFIRRVRPGTVDGAKWYSSEGAVDFTSYRLRPVVSLKSDVQITKNEGTLESPHNLK